MIKHTFPFTLDGAGLDPDLMSDYTALVKQLRSLVDSVVVVGELVAAVVVAVHSEIHIEDYTLAYEDLVHEAAYIDFVQCHL